MRNDLKRWLFLTAILATGGIAVVFVRYEMDRPVRQRERFEQVQIGMTKEDLISLMGRGSDVIMYGGGECTYVMSSWPPKENRNENNARKTFFIFFLDDDGKVKSKWIDEPRQGS